MKTRDKILETGLHLFNKFGVSQVSSRTISQELGISYGNLTYYFSRKDDIILALYTNMQQELEQKIMLIFQQVFEESFQKNILHSIFELTLKYKFIYLSITELSRQFEEIRAAEHKYFENRIRITKKIFTDLIREGYIKQEDYVDNSLTIRGLDLIFRSWIIDAETFYKGEDADKIDYYSNMIFNLVAPHLTELGLQKFKKIRGMKEV